MEKMFDAYYYDTIDCRIVETKEIFSDYQNYSRGCSSFPEYMEEKLYSEDLKSLYSYKSDLIGEIEYYVGCIEENIDAMRAKLDDLEELLDYEDEPELKWKMVEVLE